MKAGSPSPGWRSRRYTPIKCVIAADTLFAGNLTTICPIFAVPLTFPPKCNS